MNFEFWQDHFQKLHNSGVNAARIWIICNGDVGMAISADGTFDGATTAHWEDLDISLNERNYIVIYKHICLVAVLNERSPSLIVLVLILEVIKGLNCCHYIDLILLCKIEQIVKILPMSLTG